MSLKIESDFNNDFDKYIERQASSQFYNLQDTGKGHFLPSSGVVLINLAYTKYDYEEFQLSRGANNSLLFDEPIWWSTFFHEWIHCYNILGSSLGALYNYAYWMQNTAIVSSLNAFKKTDNLDLNEIRDYKERYMRQFPKLRLWELCQGLCCLFGNGYDRLFSPKVKDYGFILYTFANNFFEEEKENSISYDQFNTIVDKLCRDIVSYGDKYVDLFLEGQINDSEFDFFQKDNGFNSKEKAFILPARAILESYARLCEKVGLEKGLGEIRVVSGKYSEIDKLFNKVYHEKFTGIYFDALRYLEVKLNWILEEYGKEQFHNTCFAIFELSLMTRLHPNLLFKTNKISLEEILIQWRFKRLVDHFRESKSEVLKFFIYKKPIIIKLDEICRDLDWICYSDCLKAIADYYDSTTYYGSLTKHIVSKKLKGEVFLTNMIDGMKLPILTILDEACIYPTENYFGKAVFDDDNFFKNVVNTIIDDFFCGEFFCNNDFEATKYSINKFLSHPKLSKKHFLNYFKTRNYNLYLDIENI